MSSAFNIPADYKLVPLEPTLDMGWAYLKAARASSPTIEHSFNHAGYRAALAAAPTPPVDAVPGLVRMTDEDDGRVTLQFDCDESAQAFQLGHDCTVDINEWKKGQAVPGEPVATFEAWYLQHTGRQPTLATSRYYALTRDAKLAKAAWDAALAASVASRAGSEPVAWQERQQITPTQWSDWYERRSGWSLTRDQEIESSGIRYQFRPLYAVAPAAAASAPLKPCKSPYCECDQGRCTHPGFFDARGS